MSDGDPVIQALREALKASPSSLPLRKHLADVLLQNGKYEEAEKEYREALTLDPSDMTVKASLAEAFYHQQKWFMALVVLEELTKAGKASPRHLLMAARAYYQTKQYVEAANAYQQAVGQDASLWDAELESQLDLPTTTATQPSAPAPDNPAKPPLVFVAADEIPDGPPPELERVGVSFKDVGGMEKLKDEIRIKIIHPLENPDLYKAYGKSIGGGILMYGPPGCGKTHLARATAGEVNAYFISIGIHDVLAMYLGQSESNLHELFEMARRNRPCVVFIDEVDALGASRTDMRQSAGRHLINQFLAEMDGINSSNDGILFLAASNAPWHIDSALRRPGRFDRVLFVPPPDKTARAAILEVMLKEKPVEQIDYQQIAKATDGFSGADLKGLVDSAVESKLREAMKKGGLVPLTTQDFLRAAKGVKPSTKDWFATARNYALYSNQSGTYDDVVSYLELDKDGGLFGRLLPRRDE